MIHRIIKIFSLAGLVLVAISGGILGWQFFSARADSTYEMGGWYWSDNYGWISLNSGNAEIAEDPMNLVPYKAIVTDGVLSGWGWSSNVGWVCFGETCDPNKICDSAPTACDPNSFGTAKPTGGWQATIDSATHKIEGWAKVLSLMDSGWIHLGMGTASVAQGQRGEECYTCQAHCDIWNYDGSDPPQQTTCNTYSETVFDSCDSCFTRTYFDQANIPDAAVDSVAGGSGNICFDCNSCNKIMSADGTNGRVACASCGSCYLYGGASDSSSGGSLGWSWNGNDDGEGNLGKDGAGWIQLNPLGGESGLVYPWLQTQYGAVFGSDIIRQKSIVSGINATYCIFAQDVFNFSSKNCEKNISDVSIAFPKKNAADESYRNALGRLDLKGLSTPVKTNTSGQQYNKYGNIINVKGSYCCCQPIVLDNQVWIINGDLVIGGNCKILNASGEQAGNGSVIVNGDLRVDGNISYGPGTVADLKQLASIAWIVKGDIIVDPIVTSTVGAFIALGEDSGICRYSDGVVCDSSREYPDFMQNGYGVFFSGVSTDPLVISGLLLAKAFNFQRTYSNILQGSETVIYDGRLMANPPPGLKNLLEILPVIRDFEY